MNLQFRTAAVVGTRFPGTPSARIVAAPAPTEAWSLEWVRDAAGFAALGSEWDALHRAQAGARPFTAHGWLNAWWTEYGRPGRLRVALVRRGGRLVAAAPLLLRRRLGVGVLTAFGGALADQVDVLVDTRYAANAVRLLIELLRTDRSWQVLDLPEVGPGAALSALAAAWPGGAATLPSSRCLELTGTLDDVLAGLPGKTRHNLRTKLRKIDRLGLTTTPAPTDRLPAAVADLLALHHRQWAGRGITREHTTGRFAAFLTGAVTGLARTGQAHVLEYRLDGGLVGAELVLAAPGWLGSYLCGIAPELRGQVDTSVLRLSRLLDFAAALDAPTLSLLRGVEDYKLRWRPTEVAHQRLILGAPRAPLAATGYREAARATQRARDTVREHPRLHAHLRDLHVRTR